MGLPYRQKPNYLFLQIFSHLLTNKILIHKPTTYKHPSSYMESIAYTYQLYIKQQILQFSMQSSLCLLKGDQIFTLYAIHHKHLPLSNKMSSSSNPCTNIMPITPHPLSLHSLKGNRRYLKDRLVQEGRIVEVVRPHSRA